MKQSFKMAAFAFAGCALMFSVSSCGNSNNNSSSSADSTATTTTTTDTAKMQAKDTTAASSTATNANATFVNDVTKANSDEIKWLQAGIDKGTSKMLKDDAKHMMKDHKDLATKMMDYASKNNITVTADTASAPDMSSLDGKSGKDWDKAWTDKLVDAHQQTIDRFNRGENEVTDSTLKMMITNTLPTLKMHLDMAKKLQSSLK